VLIHRHIKSYPGFKAFPCTSAYNFGHNDLQKRQNEHSRFLGVFTAIPKYGDFTFTNECAIHHSLRSGNVYFWSKENPHVHNELQHNPPHVIWAGISGRHIFHPYFFVGSVNQHISLTMLRDWLVTQLECMNLTSKSLDPPGQSTCSLCDISVRLSH
jgi:hypothetical protein